MIEFFSAMTALDIILILIWITAVIVGATSGIIRELLILGAMLIGMIAGNVAAPKSSQGTGMVSGLGTEAALPFTYTFIVIAVAIVFYIIAHRSYPGTRLAGHDTLDHVGGAILGFLAGLIGITELVAMLLFVTDGQWAAFEGMRIAVRSQLQSTPFLPLVAQTFPFVQALVNSLLPSP